MSDSGVVLVERVRTLDAIPGPELLEDGSVRLFAPAKINLCLHVGALRDSGFHDLVSVVQLIDLYDEVTVDLSVATAIGDQGRVEVTVDAPDLPFGDTLVGAAVSAWACERGFSVAGRIVIDKRIPVGTGMGGGSSDAAAVIAHLDRLAGQPADHDTLIRIASCVGSDVPLFLCGGGAAVMTGRGEHAYPVHMPSRVLDVVWPAGASASTAEVYASFDARHLTGQAPELPDVDDVVASAQLGDFHNDLAVDAIAVCPAMGDAISRLGTAGVHVTGSGSAVFRVVSGPVA